MSHQIPASRSTLLDSALYYGELFENVQELSLDGSESKYIAFNTGDKKVLLNSLIAFTELTAITVEMIRNVSSVVTTNNSTPAVQINFVTDDSQWSISHAVIGDTYNLNHDSNLRTSVDVINDVAEPVDGLYFDRSTVLVSPETELNRIGRIFTANSNFVFKLTNKEETPTSAYLKLVWQEI